ncbi:copia protein [Tanacetum coccineum]|uniref:Copia protein n=1 Tax=Tanacetum coccineum TaxID=301880 RepID=A0ABQ5E5Z0_9ASTR
MTIIGTKWVFRNKLDENGIVSRNKARLVAQGYNQQEGIDYDETYAPVARLESIRILLAYACALDFKLFQMDVKSAFLNGFINEEVYVAQPPGFIDFEKPDHVYKLKKALYGLKQAPKAWYDRLKAFLIKHEYKIGMVDNTLFTKKRSSNLIIVQIYVDDIIFGLTCQDMCDEFAKIMHDEFEMSMMGELNFFLGLQIKQMEDGTTYLGLWYPKGTSIETVVYADSDHAGDYVDRKSTSGNHASFVEFECLLEISDQICTRFILEFYSQYQINYSDEGEMFIEFVIQNQFFSYSLQEFAQILDIPCEGVCVFNDKWSLDELAYGVPTDGPYQTNPPSPDDIISSIRIDREGQVCRIRHEEEIDVLEY